MKKDLTVIRADFGFGSGTGNYYLRDDEGNVYYWNTSSDNAYAKFQVGTSHSCSFIATNDVWYDEGTPVQTIKNVRF